MESRTDHHFVITIQGTLANGNSGVVTATGAFVVKPGATRAAAYEEILARAAAEAQLQRTQVLFFSLEPNALG